MREYELTVVIQPDLEDSAREEAVAFVQTLLTDAGATEDAVTVNQWGSRNLAYPINEFTSGYYVMIEAALDPQQTDEIERKMHFREDILRHLLVRKDD